MTLIEAIITAVMFFLKGIALLVLLGLALLLVLIIRETAWYLRELNKRKLEENENENDSI